MWVLSFLLALGALVAAASCSSTPPPTGVAKGCSISSDCNGTEICAFGTCHAQCATSKDCMGATCLPAPGGGVCELPQEVMCSGSLPCVVGLTCADDICRAPCMPGSAVGSTGACVKDQTCAKGTEKGQFICLDNGGSTGQGDGGAEDDGNGGGTDATMSDAKGDGSKHDSGDTDATNSCPSAQTQFGVVAQGEMNTNFQSGVGARTAKDLYIFSGYVGPDPTADGGGAINATYVQAFDAQTSASKGDAKFLFAQPDLIEPTETEGFQMQMYSAAVAPTGQIALVYLAYWAHGANEGLYAAFLDSAVDAGTGSDGGAAGLQLKNVVLLEAAPVYGQPYVFWSDASQAFVTSWSYNGGPGVFVAVSKFLVGGQAAGGSSDPVPTNDPNGYAFSPSAAYTLVPSSVSGSVGESGNLFGVAYLDNPMNNPAVTVLDSVGNQVGSSFELVPATDGAWSAVAGTSNGFVYFYDKPSPPSVAEVFLPTSGDAGVVGSPSDGGDAGAFPTFSFTGGVRAYSARAVGDGTGGAGGVGLALLNPTKVSFAYVNADGVGHQGPNSVFAHTYAAGDMVSLTNVAGSFVVSLYSASTHSTQVVASGCP